MTTKQDAPAPSAGSRNECESGEWPLEHTAPARTILVVEDEPLVRLFVARALRAAGYRVLEAESAESAVALLRVAGSSLGLLLSDVGLPGASGPELLAQARLLEPELPALLMSAWSQASVLQRYSLAPETTLLQKPFAVRELLDQVEVLMPRPSAPSGPR